MALVSLSCCFHKVTSIDSVKSGPGISFSVELDGPAVVLWGSSGSVLAQLPCVGAHKVYSC